MSAVDGGPVVVGGVFHLALGPLRILDSPLFVVILLIVLCALSLSAFEPWVASRHPDATHVHAHTTHDKPPPRFRTMRATRPGLILPPTGSAPLVSSARSLRLRVLKVLEAQCGAECAIYPLFIKYQTVSRQTVTA